MSDLMTAKDVEVKVFKKVRFGGYSVPEVEDFLNQVADDLEAYTVQLDEKDNRIQELEAFAKKQESMNDAIKDALILARKAAKDMEDKAQAETEKLISDAQAEAEKIIAEADGKVQERLNDAERKSSDILAHARSSANEIIQTSQDRRAQAEQSRAGIEQELEALRRKAEDEAEDILANARAEAKKLVADAKQEAEQYNEQIRFLSMRKQQFLKDTVALLLDFGKFIDRAQEDVEEELDDNTGSITPETENASVETE